LAALATDAAVVALRANAHILAKPIFAKTLSKMACPPLNHPKPQQPHPPQQVTPKKIDRPPVMLTLLHLTSRVAKNAPKIAPKPLKAAFLLPAINICSTQTRILLKKGYIQNLLVAK
jgi:hypothetical protein